jgi:nucleoid DNA-binding protein
MPTPKLVTATAAELIAQELGMKTKDVREVLDAFDRVADRALVSGAEVEVGSFGYLSLREPVNTKPPRGEVTRGKRVAFREKDANRHRWKT